MRASEGQSERVKYGASREASRARSFLTYSNKTATVCPEAVFAMSTNNTKRTQHEDKKKALRTAILKAKPRKDTGERSIATLISTPLVDYGVDDNECGWIGQDGDDFGP